MDNTTKPSNPKDLLGSNKVPFHLVPPIAIAHEALAFQFGALQYGRANWRGVGVRASIYVDACLRHVLAFHEGEDKDPDSGLSHLAHARACLAILLDAMACKNLTDDRQYPGNYRAELDALTPEVKRLKALVAKMGKDIPHHYTIEDTKIEQSSGCVHRDIGSCSCGSGPCQAIPVGPPIDELSRRLMGYPDPRQTCQLPERCGCDKCFAASHRPAAETVPQVQATLQVGDIVAFHDVKGLEGYNIHVGDAGEVHQTDGTYAVNVKYRRGFDFRYVWVDARRLTLCTREVCHCGPDGACSKCPTPGEVVPFRTRTGAVVLPALPGPNPNIPPFERCKDCDSPTFCQATKRCMRGRE